MSRAAATADDAAPLPELGVLGELEAHLLRAQQVLADTPFDGEDAAAANPLSAVTAVARSAIASLSVLLFGQGLFRGEKLHIALMHSWAGAKVAVDQACLGEVGRRDIAAFIAELRRRDAQLLRSSELLGLLLGLCGRWSVAGFAPPLVLHTLRETAPRILELGSELAA